MGVIIPPYRTPCGNHRAIASPTVLPSAAPILKTGMKMPDGTGTVELMMEKMNWNRIPLFLLTAFIIFPYMRALSKNDRSYNTRYVIRCLLTVKRT